MNKNENPYLLLIDDCNVILHSTSAYFQNKGYKIGLCNPTLAPAFSKNLEAKNLHLAVSFYIMNQFFIKNNQTPNFLVLDYNLGRNLNGIDLAICLREEFKFNNKTIFISGSEIPTDKKEKARDRIELCDFIETKDPKLGKNIQYKLEKKPQDFCPLI